MKESLLNKLEKIAERQQEIHALLAEPSIINDNKRFRELSKEAAGTAPVVECFNDYRKNLKQIDAAREMLKDDDREIRRMADEELEQAELENDRLESELQKLLLPKDPADKNNIFLEIRAGTGGEEAALFAGDLMRMYSRYAEERGWKIETLRKNYSDLNGYKEIIMKIIGEIRVRCSPRTTCAGHGIPGQNPHIRMHRRGTAGAGRSQ
jgi:peptide chain release factor 1